MRRQARVVSGPASWAMRFFAVHNTAMMGAGQFQPPLEALVAGVAREHWTGITTADLLTTLDDDLSDMQIVIMIAMVMGQMCLI
ncbi:hypothetical protein MHYP_G00117480 [Metynnis hypsauchen]